jgi:hypothetical protein
VDSSTIMLIFLGINVLHTTLNLFLMWVINRKETFAIIAHKNGSNTVHKINPHLSHFVFKKQAYIIPVKYDDYTIKIRKKNYIRYIQNNPEPQKWWNDENPQMLGDVFSSIIDNEGLKLLNTPPLSFNWKIALAIVAVIIVIIVFVNMGGTPTATPTG